MPDAPIAPKIFQITHLDNIAGIVQAKVLWSDARRIEHRMSPAIVGMRSIKARRLALPVHCHPGTTVGEYVPFYFCPRSIMLFILHCANHPELEYRGGQQPIVHLVADLQGTVAWAEALDRRWALTNRNASSAYADFYSSLAGLDKIDWPSIATRDFSTPSVKEGKQAEFLVHESFPWQLVEEVGVIDSSVAERCRNVLSQSHRQPAIHVRPAWYF